MVNLSMLQIIILTRVLQGPILSLILFNFKKGLKRILDNVQTYIMRVKSPGQLDDHIHNIGNLQWDTTYFIGYFYI